MRFFINVPSFISPIVRFHILVPHTVPFNINQDRVVICGLGEKGDEEWTQGVEMNLKHSVKEKHFQEKILSLSS